MANTFTQIYLQFLFAVQDRISLIDQKWKNELYQYISGIVRNNKLWNNDNPHIEVLTLPEAASPRLVCIAENVANPFEIDGSSALAPEAEPNDLKSFKIACHLTWPWWMKLIMPEGKHRHQYDHCRLRSIGGLI